jgi:hypothetical protein
MQTSALTRRAALLLPVLIAACGRKERTDFPPLRYSYLPPILLSVGSINIEQRFYPSGMPPDVTALSPVHPVEALRAMAEDRLQAVGSVGQAVFAITNATLSRERDTLTCALAVELEIYQVPGVRSGFARAIASRQRSGDIDDLRGALYDLVDETMKAMNVEFEYQVNHNLRPWLASSSAAPTAVQQQTLPTGPDSGAPPPQPTPMQPMPQQPMGAQPMPPRQPIAPQPLPPSATPGTAPPQPIPLTR